MRKAVVGALVATTAAFGTIAAPAGAHERHDGDRGRSEQVESRRGARGHRDGRHDHDKERRGHDGRHHRGDWDRRDRGEWNRGDRGDRELSTEDQAFLELAAQVGQIEIFQGQLAVARGTDPAVQEYGRLMVVDHLQQLTDQLRLHDKYDVELPALTEEQVAAVQALLDTPVEEFDVTYLTAQVAAHEQALAVFTAQAEDSDSRKVQKFAEKYVPALQHHLELAQETLDALAVPVA